MGDAVSLERTIAIARDGAFVLSVIFIGWKVRGWAEPVFDFFSESKRFFTEARDHMMRVELGINIMEKNMQTLLTNHLHHLQQTLEDIASNKTPPTGG